MSLSDNELFKKIITEEKNFLKKWEKERNLLEQKTIIVDSLFDLITIFKWLNQLKIYLFLLSYLCSQTSFLYLKVGVIVFIIICLHSVINFLFEFLLNWFKLF